MLVNNNFSEIKIIPSLVDLTKLCSQCLGAKQILHIQTKYCQIEEAHDGDEGKITLVAQTQPVGQGAVASQSAKLEAVPTHACLVSWLHWKVGYRLVGSTKQDGCPAVETGGKWKR